MSKKCALMAILAYVPALFPMEKDAAIPSATALVYAVALQAAAEPAAIATPSSPKIDVKLDSSARVDSPTPATLIFQHMNKGEFAAIDALLKNQPALIYEEKPTISGGPETVLAKFLRTVIARQTPDNLKYFETWLSYLDPNSSLAKSIGRELLSSISARKKDKVKDIFEKWLSRANALKASSPKAPFIVSPSHDSVGTQHSGEREIKPTQKNLSAQFEEEAQNAKNAHAADREKIEATPAAPAARESLLYQEHARKVRAERKAQEEAEQKAMSASQEDPKLLSQDDVLKLSFGGLMKTEVNPSVLIDGKKDGAEPVAPVIPTVVEDKKNALEDDVATECVSFANVVAEAAANVKKRNLAIAGKVAASEEIKSHVLVLDSAAAAAHEEAALMAQEEARQRAEQEKAERKVHADIEEAEAKLRADAEAARKEVEDLEKKDAGSLPGTDAAIKGFLELQKKEEAALQELVSKAKDEAPVSLYASMPGYEFPSTPYISAVGTPNAKIVGSLPGTNAAIKAFLEEQKKEEDAAAPKEQINTFKDETPVSLYASLPQWRLPGTDAAIKNIVEAQKKDDEEAARKEVEKTKKAEEDAAAEAAYRSAQRLARLMAARDSRAREEEERLLKEKAEEKAKAELKALAEDAKRKEEIASKSIQDLKAAQRQARLQELRAREESERVAKGKVEESAKTSMHAVDGTSSKASAEDAKRKDEAAHKAGQDLKAAEDLRAREAAQKAKEEADARAIARQARLKAVREKNSI